MKRFMIPLLTLFLISFLGVISCDESNSPADSSDDPIVGDPSMPIETRNGELLLADDATVDFSELKVITFADATDLSAEGGFTVDAPASDNFQIIIIAEQAGGTPVYLGLYDPVTGTVTVSDSTTALGLTLLNPMLIFTDQPQRQEYLDAVILTSEFAELLAALRLIYASDDPTSALDYDQHPEIFQLAGEAMYAAIDALVIPIPAGDRDAIGDPPVLEDLPGAAIKFVNPRFVWYGAGIYENDQLNDTVSVYRKEDIIGFEWGWPPNLNMNPRETEYALGDGVFDIYLAKGLDYTLFSQPNDPKGRGTILNTATGILYLVELFIGNIPFMDEASLLSLPDHFNVTPAQAALMTDYIARDKVEDFIIVLGQVMAANAEDLTYWIWQSDQGAAAEEFITQIGAVLQHMSLVMKIMGFADQEIPFFWDLLVAPAELTYHVEQVAGVLSLIGENHPPAAEFIIDPPAGVVDMPFQFNAALTTDDHDDLMDLEFRWDFDGDGIFDTDWSASTSSATYTYSVSSLYVVILQVRDTGGLIGEMSHHLSVGGGAGTATHIKVFKNRDAWDTSALIPILQDLGFTEGVGEMTYELFTSADFYTVDLFPGEDLVILHNDQNQTFYNDYAANQVKFTNFVYSGGSMFWEACDQGWGGGSMASAGVVLPGGVGYVFDYDYNNYLPYPGLPLVVGIPVAMQHNYASHEHFIDLVEGTTVYCIDESDEPTLIEYNLGGGWVIMTGQPLEHQVVHPYGDDEMSALLPRICGYFTGVEVPVVFREIPKTQGPFRPSHE